MQIDITTYIIWCILYVIFNAIFSSSQWHNDFLCLTTISAKHFSRIFIFVLFKLFFLLENSCFEMYIKCPCTTSNWISLMKQLLLTFILSVLILLSVCFFNTKTISFFQFFNEILEGKNNLARPAWLFFQILERWSTQKIFSAQLCIRRRVALSYGRITQKKHRTYFDQWSYVT